MKSFLSNKMKELLNITPPSPSDETTASSQQAIIILKQRQQRLLLLRHASICKAEPGKCTETPHCVKMKEVWNHIKNCRDQNCDVPHCVSSRCVLSHYHRCKDSGCTVCEPVRVERFKHKFSLAIKAHKQQ
jgi:E1A/CREB-binding protein